MGFIGNFFSLTFLLHLLSKFQSIIFIGKPYNCMIHQKIEKQCKKLRVVKNKNSVVIYKSQDYICFC